MEDKYKTNPPAFLGKIVTMLTKENEHCIRWNDEGNGIVIVDCQKFTRELMPKYFKTRKINSFIRQLNFYGFKKACTPMRSNKSCEFTHPFFKRGQESILLGIKRKNVNNINADELTFKEIDKLKKENEEIKQKLLKKENDYDNLLAEFKKLKEKCNTPTRINDYQNLLPPLLDLDDYKIESSRFIDELFSTSDQSYVLPPFQC